jgi:cell division protein FtsI/penicillin-binding protein 2
MREIKTLRKSTINWMLFSVFGVVFFRLTDLGILQRNNLVDLAHKQQRIAIEVPAKRGEILDRRGSVLATSVRSPSVYAIPRLIADSKKNELAGKLASILKLSPSEIEKRLRRDKAFIWLKRKVSEETAKRIQALGDPNVQLTHEPKRYYPHGSLTGQLLGLCDIDDRGIEGIELAFDSVLRGKNGIRYTRRDALGHQIAALEEKSIPPVDGHHLI